MSRDLFSAFDIQRLIAFKMHVFIYPTVTSNCVCVDGLCWRSLLHVIMHSCKMFSFHLPQLKM